MGRMSERSPEWVSTAPVLIENARTIKASPDAVWARIADHETWPEWFTDLSSVQATASPVGVGGAVW